MINTIVKWIRRLPTGIRWTTALTIVYMLAFALSPGSWLQTPFAFLFLLACPGLLLVDWLNLSDRVIGTTMVVASSLAINILITTILAGTATYSPEAGVLATAVAALSLSVISFSLNRPRDPMPTKLS
jgi:hypothetical protein